MYIYIFRTYETGKPFETGGIHSVQFDGFFEKRYVYISFVSRMPKIEIKTLTDHQLR